MEKTPPTENFRMISRAGLHRTCAAFTAVALLAAMGCELEVNNPNSLVEDPDLKSPTAGRAIANGALWTVSEGIGYIMAPNFAATDEGTWIGSRDAWRALDFGDLTDVNNEFVDAAWLPISEGRWMADKAILQLKEFDDAGTLEDATDLGRAYLYAGLVRIAIADMFDNFVFSDKRDAGEPIGTANMSSLYDQAITNFDAAEAIAKAEKDTDLETKAVGLRARAKYSKAVWGKVNPSVNTTDPLVDAGATDALAALSLMGLFSDYKWQLEHSAATSWNDLSWQVNGRLELDIGYVAAKDAGDALPEDPIDIGATDPRVQAIIDEFAALAGGGNDAYSPQTVLSEREIHLILAESGLAKGDVTTFTTHINHLRVDLDGMTAFSGQIADMDMLQHERRANLFMQGRRLMDMYRFEVKSAMWQPDKDAILSPGTLFPITIRERRANSNIKSSD